MSTGKPSLKALLLQIRRNAAVRLEEHLSFAQFSGLAKEQITVLNVFDDIAINSRCLQGYDALFVGGASEASVLDPLKYPFNLPIMDLLNECVARSFPVFASCYGFQLVVLALGGVIEHVERDFEMGNVAVHLTDSGLEDPLLHDMPNPFSAIAVHQDKCMQVPQGCEQLAVTDQCVHALRVAAEPFWAFQFHPEVDKTTLVKRLTHFQACYTDDVDHLQSVLAGATETPEANALLRKFIDKIVLA